MSLQNNPTNSGHEPTRRDIAAIELDENCTPAAQNHVAQRVAELVGQALDALNNERQAEGKAPLEGLRSVAVSATSTAIGAVEGTLKGKSLEGALKEAQIIREYAAASKEQAEADRIRFDMAWAQLQNTLALFQTLGIEVRLVTLPDGRPGITIGGGLALPLPGVSATDASAASMSPPVGG
jgi:hypothetical protein